MINIVCIKSISYTGTTWMNLMLGSHRKAFALGAGDKILDKLADPKDGVCSVHKTNCSFWNDFIKRYVSDKNIFVQISKFARRSTIVINNPSPNRLGLHLNHRGLRVKTIGFHRDGRAIAASYWRKNPDKSFECVVRDWLSPGMLGLKSLLSAHENIQVRYEDVMSDPMNSLAKIGKYVGLTYSVDSLKFWEFDHHIVSGSPSVIGFVCMAQGLPVIVDAQRKGTEAFYQEQFQLMQADPLHGFRDERWKQELKSEHLELFDHYCGAMNREFGYE